MLVLFWEEATLVGGVGENVVLGAGGKFGVRLTSDSGGFGLAQLNMLDAQFELPPVLWQPVETARESPQAIMRFRESRDMLVRIT